MSDLMSTTAGLLTIRGELSFQTMQWEVNNLLQFKTIELRSVSMVNRRRLKRFRDKAQLLAKAEWLACPRPTACFQALRASKLSEG